ncbi:alpha/beta fold hydrolase [Roseovarius pelagicus]|uniref:Alpha/beta hydrolase n=1 Tax=Roseovarius pelagicus TaxID=2980108 RepID=A0ABY6D8K6_9RHOB|nr:alpha/beta hydrolase [Roseovarius pelagicus]UXX81513.1 alpha/beta hydrolase [Roseovarius pelagicus]
MAVNCAYSVRGTGPYLVFIHGIGARRAAFDKIVDALEDRFTCVTYDLRGHGQSPIPKEAFGLDDLVDDLEALFERAGIDQAHVAGHSLGGMIGPAFARRCPDKVLSLGLWSTAAFRTEDDSAKVRAVVDAMREKGIEQVLRTLAGRWFTDAFAEAHPDVIEWRAQQVLATPADIFLNVFDIYADTEMAPWLHEVDVPAQVLTGELDGGCNPRLNKQIAEALPQSELVILDGLKHAIMIEASDRVIPPVEAFLNQKIG